MKVSTRSRYGLRVMINLALNFNKRKTLLKEIAENQNLSEKYLSLIMVDLTKNGLVKSTRGSIGGYYLSRSPETITTYDIINTLEGKFDLVDCVSCPDLCVRNDDCLSRNFWSDITDSLHEKMKSISLNDIIRNN